MSEIQQIRDKAKQIEGFVESGAVVMSKKIVAFWHMVSTVAGGVIGLFIHKYFSS